MNSNEIRDVKIRKLTSHENIPYHLLLLADPSKSLIDKYIPAAETYVAELEGNIVGVYVLLLIDPASVEIKNIAVGTEHQGKGVGKLLLTHAIQTATDKGFREIIIGTANSSIAQLYLYQKQGFEITELKMNFFVKHYNEQLYENGIQCKHLIVLTKQLLKN